MDRRLRSVEVVVDLVGDERRERREQLRRRPPGSRAGSSKARRSSPSPEAAPGQPHVPVREVVDELRDRAAGERRVVVVHPLDHALASSPTAATGSTGPDRSPSAAEGSDVEVRVLDVERVRVPERLEELAHRLADRLEREAVAVPGLLRGEVVPAEGVRAVLAQHVPGHDHVALRLRHLLAVGVEDQAEAEAGPVRRLRRTAASTRRAASRTSRASGRAPRRCSPPGSARSKMSSFSNGACHCANGMQPESHQTSIRSGTRRISPPHSLAGEHDLVDVGPVQVLRRLAAALARSPPASRRRRTWSSLAAPDRQRRAPVALARQRPVDVVLEPLAEAAVLDVLGVPVDRLVGGEQLVLHRGGAHVPVRLGVVDERRVAAPAVRIGVLVLAGAEQAAGLAQRLDDRGGPPRARASRRTGPVRSSKVPSGRTGLWIVRPFSVGEPEVVLAEGGAGVDHAGAVLDRDEVARRGRCGRARRSRVM